MIFDQNILLLLLIWFLGWAIYFFAGKRRMQLAIDTDISTAYFFLLATFVFFINKDNLPEHIEDNIFFYFAAIIAVFIAVNHIYFLIRKNFKEPLSLIDDHPTDHWLEGNRKSIFVTLSHILFQQIIITSIILSLWGKLGDLTQVVKYFVVIFGLMHLPLLIFKGFKFTILYTIPAMISGTIFPILLVKFGFGGLVFNYIIHSSFYVLLTYLFWYQEGRIEE